MTNFPMMFLLTVVSTNWVGNGDWKRESGTNWVKQRLVVETNMYLVEVKLCTNQTHVLTMHNDTTNGTTRWTLAMPPLPNIMTKE